MDEQLQTMITSCMKELEAAHEARYAPERADRTAALFLDTQLRLASYVVDIDFRTRMSKNELDRVSAEKYFELKAAALTGADKKMTEASLEHAIAKDEAVYKVKEEVARSESEQKKWANVMSIMNNGHIFFRTVSKNI